MADAVTRFLVYGSDDADDMEFPVSTATCCGVHDTQAEAEHACMHDYQGEYQFLHVVQCVFTEMTTVTEYGDPDED